MNKLELKMKHRTISLLDKYFTGESIDFKQMFAIIMPIFVDQAFLIFMSLLKQR